MSEHSTSAKATATSDAARAGQLMEERRRKAADALGMAFLAALGFCAIVTVLIFATR